MIAAGWFVLLVFVALLLSFAQAWLYLREQRRLVSALVAKNTQEFALLERTPITPKDLAKSARTRRQPIPETEGEFIESTPRPIGL